MSKPRLKATPDFESDNYNDLLIIEKRITELKKRSMLSELESDIIDLVSEGYLFNDVGSILGIHGKTVSKIFINVCERIAYSLGNEFTDAGFVDVIADKNKLTEEEQLTIKEYIASNKKHTIVRRPIKSNDKTRPVTI